MHDRPALSIRHRLVLFTSGLLIAALGIVAGVAYVHVRHAAVVAANRHLQYVTEQLAGLLTGSASQLRARMHALAGAESARSLLRPGATPGPRDSAALAALRATVAAPAVAGVELWDVDGRRVAAVGAPPPALSSTAARELMGLVRADSAAVGWMREAAGGVTYPIIVRVREGGALLGYAVEWRRLATAGQARTQLGGLLGRDTRLYLGNARGDVWTDFAALVAAPPVGARYTSRVSTYERGGRDAQLGAARGVAGTPWVLAVEVPRAPVLAGANDAVLWIGGLAALVLAVAVAGAWTLSGRLTRPLADLAGAAAVLSTGDYARRVVVGRRDEVGALAGAFNTMAESIAGARTRLEAHARAIEDQAEELAGQAAELEIANQELSETVEETVRARDTLDSALRERARVAAELDAALGSAPVGFAFYDVDLRFQRVNETLTSITGLPVADHVGRTLADVIPALAPAIEAHMRHVIATGECVLDVEFTGMTPAQPGVARHWLTSYYPIRTADGALLGVGSVVSDRTGYKQLEQQFFQAQKMEAVGRLAGGVAHDFNNILTAIASFSEFAIAELSPGSQPRADIEQVRLAAERAAKLTHQLLAFSRQQVLQPRVLDLNETVRAIEPMLRRLIGEDVDLVTVLDEDAWAVLADPGQIEQVIVNLVVNARDAMPDGGSLVIETGNAELDEAYARDTHHGASPGPHVVLSVSDTGVGLDAATRARIFEPFFSTKGPGQGTGLGLSTVYGVVKQSGGSIWVYSEPGQGATFKVYLPRETCGSDVSAVTPADVGDGAIVRPAVVLVVEDEAAVRAVARRTLEHMGHIVVEAVDGASAMAAVASASSPVELVITDLVMPGMGGRELVTRLRAAGREVGVLYMSGYTADAVNRRSLLDPSDAFLEKPFTPALLRSKVADALRVGEARLNASIAPLARAG